MTALEPICQSSHLGVPVCLWSLFDCTLEQGCQRLLRNQYLCHHTRSLTPPAVVSVGGKQAEDKPVAVTAPLLWGEEFFSQLVLFAVASQCADHFLVSPRHL